jgi:hypothetical protein
LTTRSIQHQPYPPPQHNELSRPHQRSLNRYLPPTPVPVLALHLPHPTKPLPLTTPLARVEALCNAIYDERTVDPHGGDGYLSTILRAVKPQDTSEVSTVNELGEAKDYNTSAQKALTIEEQTLGLVRRHAA